MNRSTLSQTVTGGGLVLVGAVAVAQTVGFSLLGVPSFAEVGELISLTTDCPQVPVPMFSAPSLVVFALLLATTGAARLRRRGAAWLLVLAALAVSSFASEVAEGAACDTSVDWEAASASESFQTTGPTFDFTPTQPGYFDVTATTGGEIAEATIPVCPVGEVADECGVCGGDGWSCLCITVLAVGYPASGNTCNFFNHDGPNKPNLPGIALDEFTYNEFFTGQGYELPFGYDGGQFGTAINDDSPHYGTVGRAHGCGACLQVTGENGSAVFMVREIADYNSVAQNALPRGVHLDSNYIDQVRTGNGMDIDVTIQPVPCPFDGNILIAHRIYNDQQTWYWNALEYTPYNMVYPIKKMEIRAEVGHTEWYDLPKKWTNKYVLGNYNPLGGQIPFPDPMNGPVRFRITSVYDEVLITPPIQQAERPLAAEANGWAYYDLGVNFEPRPYAEGACTPNYFCGNWQLDPGEECESSQQLSPTCASLGAGTGTAYCDPGTCLWDRSTCSSP
ncbi:MAG: hypothetical protein CL908_13615 [Deltaproteobacteria bacterium]|nr:hypothetical protein [Deltaproteobacteria bacterium]